MALTELQTSKTGEVECRKRGLVDLMISALEDYAVLKAAGKGQGVDDLRKILGSRFARSARSSLTPDTPPGLTLI